MNLMEQAMYLHGVGYEYTKYTGELVVFPYEVRKRALVLAGVNIDSEEALHSHNHAIDVQPWCDVVESVSLVNQADMLLKIKIPEVLLGGSISIEIEGHTYQNIMLSEEKRFGDYRFNGTLFVEVGVTLPSLAVGYYSCQVILDEQTYRTEVWIVPSKAFCVASTDKLMGLSVQLYTLNEHDNLGIGDFGDLLRLIEISAASIDYILLNPLHELFEHDPERASPYSPNHRCFLNPIYIDISQCLKSLPLKNKSRLQSDYEKQVKLITREKVFIDYTSVSHVKYALLERIYDEYKRLSPDFLLECRQEFQNIYSFDIEASNQAILSRDEFLQWIANKQLKTCQNRAIELGMKIGLISDLAVGCAQDGREFKEYRSLFSASANVGAPPDPWAEEGQDWGLPALDTKRIAQDNYGYFKRLIRSNMADVGGLRIDHVMAIRRLWWCFSMESGVRTGCYMYYPFEHLLALLKIESQLNKTILIGEDLGVVPPEVRDALHSSAISSNILFYFEKDHLGQFVDPTWHRTNSLLMIANHDVPPFYGWWQHSDIGLRLEYGLIDSNKKDELDEARLAERLSLCDWLNRFGKSVVGMENSASDIYNALLIVLSKSKAKYLTIQLDDLDENTIPVNVPGTNMEFPNWRRRLSKSVAEIFEQKADLMATVKHLRNTDV